MQHILLTGGTGAIGSAVLAQLLDCKNVRVSVLLRAGSSEELATRGAQLLAFCGAGTEMADAVEFVRGDVSAVDLGLTSADSSRLASQVTGIIHSAGNVKLNQTLDVARRNAVGATEQILKFARRVVRLEKMDAVSTIGVGGRMSGVVPERRLTETRQFNNNYERAKAESEELLWQAIDDGMPVTIHRPSMVVGDSRTGAVPHFQVFYYLCDFLSGKHSFGFLPDFGAAGLDIIPADYVARAICYSATHQADVGRVLHLCAGDQPNMRLVNFLPRIRAIYKDAGRRCRPLRILSQRNFLRVTSLASRVTHGRFRKSARSLQYFLPYLALAQRFAVENTSGLLHNRGISVPHVDSYLQIVLGSYLESQTTGSQGCVRG